MAAGTSSFKGQNLIIGGQRIDTGRAKGAWLTVALNTDEVVVEEGVDGEAWFTDSFAGTGVMTIVLTASSRWNNYFSGLVLANRNAPTGLAFEAQFSELGGTTKYTASKCKFLKMADGTWGDGAQVRSWRVGILELEGVVGGLIDTPVISAADALALLG